MIAINKFLMNSKKFDCIKMALAIDGLVMLFRSHEQGPAEVPDERRAGC